MDNSWFTMKYCSIYYKWFSLYVHII